MKIIYFVLLFGVSCFVDSSVSHTSAEHWRGDDIDANAERPCPHNEINCVRRYFAKHSHCKVAHGPVPDPLFLKRSTLALAIGNTTFILNDAKIKGLNGKITEFTINKKTNNLVIAAEMRDIIVYSPHTVLKYHRKMKEPIVLSDESVITYESVTFTAVIPNIDNLEFTKTEVSSYLENSRPPYAIGPGVIKSLDPVAINSFNKLVSNVPEVIKEAFTFQGPVFMLNYIQYNICDFGFEIFGTTATEM